MLSPLLPPSISLRSAVLGALLVMVPCLQVGWAESRLPSVAPEGPEGCYCLGQVGNVNCDYLDAVTLADVMMLIDHLFISGARLPNPEEANASGDPEGEISLADVMVLIDHLFVSRCELPECPGPYNTPPETYLVIDLETPAFINAETPVHVGSGLRMNWGAVDRVDHPYHDPVFTFEYRVYGPYTDSEFEWIRGHVIHEVFRTNRGEVLRRNMGLRQVVDSVWDGQAWLYDTTEAYVSILVCDTIWLPGGVREIHCDTVAVDTISGENPYGRIDSLFDIDDPSFAPYDRLAGCSGVGESAWTTALADSVYDLFAAFPADTTVLANFVVWVRARDPIDPRVIDPLPVFRTVQVIDPKHERDVLIVDMAVSAAENRARSSSNQTFWRTAVQAWIENGLHDGTAVFSVADDWRHESFYAATATSSRPVRILTDVLRHKTVVVLQDTPSGGLWSAQVDEADAVMTAMLRGVNVWVVARVPFGSVILQTPHTVIPASQRYSYYFGAVHYVCPGWGAALMSNPSSYGLPRLEDFVGAHSTDTLLWPDLAIDTALLRIRYVWEGCVPSPSCYSDPLCDPISCFPFYPYNDEDFQFLGAIPQVGWIQTAPEAEVIYTFQSLYGPIHGIDPGLSFEGLPIMHRVDRGLFRSVHAGFSPLAMNSAGAQQLVVSVLNWLYEPWLPNDSSGVPGSESRGEN